MARSILPGPVTCIKFPGTKVKGCQAKNQLTLVPFVERTAYGSTDISPLMSKVGQESGLRHFGCQAYLNPATGSESGVPDGCRVLIQTNKGSVEADARFDASIMPGIVAVSGTMNDRTILSLCEMTGNATVQPTPVKIQKV